METNLKWKENEVSLSDSGQFHLAWNDLDIPETHIDLNVELKSHLPLVEEIMEEKRHCMMNVKNVSIHHDQWKVVKTLFEVRDEVSGEVYSFVGKLGILEDDCILGYLPSKIWVEGGDEGEIETFRFLFYINDSLPDQLRPFKEKTYVLWNLIKSNHTLLYDLNTRLFMDQIKTDIGWIYVMVFDEANYKLIVDDGI